MSNAPWITWALLSALSIDKLSVVLVAVFGVAILGEHLALHHWLGVTVIGAGALLRGKRA